MTGSSRLHIDYSKRQQLEYAEKRGHQIALIAGPDEFAQGTWKVKHLASRTETAVAEGEVVDELRRRLD